MEKWQKEDICVDAFWNIIYSEASFYNKKVNLMSYIYNEIIEKTHNSQNSKLSLQAKKILFDNNITKYFSTIRDASLKTIIEDSTPSTMDLEGDILNERGFARLSVLSNINSEVEYSPRQNKNIYLALGNVLNTFSLAYTKYEDQGMFEIVYRYMEKHPTLFASSPKAIANSFCSNIENTDIVNKLEKAFQDYLQNRIKAFQKDLRAQMSDTFSSGVIMDVLNEVDKEYNMFSTTFNSVVSKNIPNKIINKYFPPEEEDPKAKRR